MAKKQPIDIEKAPPPREKKTVDPPAEEGLPGWMATFADMVTLLLTFFVLLLSFANQDIVKFKMAMGSVKQALGSQKEDVQALYAPYSPAKYERKEIKLTKEDKKLLDLILGIKAVVEGETAEDKSSRVSTDSNGVMQRVDNAAMFRPGSTELTPEAEKILDRVIRVLKQKNVDIVIGGHTDDAPFASADYPSNWELSSARAARALRYLVEKGGIDPMRLKAAGYAGSRPLVPNDSPENRARNNRIEIYYHAPGAEGW